MFNREMSKDQIRDILVTMDKDQLKQVAREQGIKLYTVVPEKMRTQMCSTIYSRLHHGDAFWKA